MDGTQIHYPNHRFGRSDSPNDPSGVQSPPCACTAPDIIVVSIWELNMLIPRFHELFTLYSEDGETLSNIPFPSTKKYVTKVIETKKIYEKLYK